MIIDAHLHLPVATEDHTYVKAKNQLMSDLQKDQMDYAILIPDNISGSVIGDLDTCLELIKGEPRLFLLGVMDIEHQSHDWIVYLESLIINRKIVGMKIFPGHDPVYPTDLRLYPLYSLCQDYNVPMVIHTGQNTGHPEVAQYNDPKYIVEIAQRFPRLPIVIAHFFWPKVDYCFELTCDCENIYFDTSGLADPEVVRETGKEVIERVLLKTLAKNSKKVIFGTDYAMCDRQKHIDLINKLPISNKVRENIFWRNAVELFNLPVGTGTLPS